MKNTIKIIGLVLSLSTLLLGIDTGTLNHFFERGNDAYLNEQYENAIGFYEQVLENGAASGNLYYNLGNAYYKTNQLGPAILNYERAKKMMPNNDNVKYNLQLCNLKIRDRIDVPPQFFLFRWHQAFVILFSAKTWGCIFIFTVLLMAVIFSLFWLVNMKRGRIILKPFLIGLAALVIISGYGLIRKNHLETRSSEAIILVPEVESLSAPQEGTTQLFLVHEGTKVTILDEDDSWVKIELIDGNQGWVQREFLGII